VNPTTIDTNTSSAMHPGAAGGGTIAFRTVAIHGDRAPHARLIRSDQLKIHAIRAIDLPGLGAGLSAASDDPAAKEPTKDDAAIAGIMKKDPNLAKQLAREYAAINSKWAFIWKPHALLDVQSSELYSLKSFHSIEATRKIAMPAADDRNTRKAPVTPLWLASKHRREYSKLVYEPGLGTDIQAESHGRPPAWNLWRGFDIDPAAGDIRPWCRLLEHLFSNADEARAYFERWVASQVQNLNTKHYVSVLLWGTQQGSGKSLTGEVIGSLFGDNYRELNNLDWRSNFNGWARCKRFLLINEIVTDRASDLDLLKNYITQSTLRINQKGIEQYDLRDSICYLLTSNKPDALKLEGDDRRFWVWEVSHQIDQNVANEIGRWKNTKAGRAALLHHLLHLDLRDFDPRARAPMTRAKSEMIAASRTTLDEFVRDEIDAAREGSAPPVVLVDQLLAKFEHARQLKDPPHEVANALRRAGAVRLKQVRIPREIAVSLRVIEADDTAYPRYGKRFRPWALIDPDRWQEAMTEAEIRAALESAIPRPESLSPADA